MNENKVVFCLRCGRRLKSETAQKMKMGKVCFEKSNIGVLEGQMSIEQLQDLKRIEESEELGRYLQASK